MAAKHDAYGWWLQETGVPEPQAPLDGDLDADVVVVGGGYTGMWTAWLVSELEPEARIVVLEADRCGMGPSGRNGGVVQPLWGGPGPPLGPGWGPGGPPAGGGGRGGGGGGGGWG